MNRRKDAKRHREAKDDVNGCGKRGKTKNPKTNLSPFFFFLFTPSRQAFSLAEVLITLGIIGVVASLTLPTLINNIQDAQYKTAYKKSYSMLSQALSKAGTDGLLVDSPQKDNFLAIMSEFKLTKKCVVSNGLECWDNTGESYSPGYPSASSYGFIDASGMAFIQYHISTRVILVDTNGAKKPNEWGKDRFSFWLMDEKNNYNTGIPVKVSPYDDNSVMCSSSHPELTNKCVKDQNYYGTSWLYK